MVLEPRRPRLSAAIWVALRWRPCGCAPPIPFGDDGRKGADRLCQREGSLRVGFVFGYRLRGPRGVGARRGAADLLGERVGCSDPTTLGERGGDLELRQLKRPTGDPPRSRCTTCGRLGTSDNALDRGGALECVCELCWLNVQINELAGPRGDQDALRPWACTELRRIHRHLRTTLHEEASGRADLVWRSRCGPRLHSHACTRINLHA